MLTRLLVFIFLFQTAFSIAQNTTDIEIENFSNMDNIFSEILIESSPWQLTEWKKINKENGKLESTEIENLVYQFNEDQTFQITSESYTLRGDWEIIDKNLYLIEKGATIKKSHSIIRMERMAFSLEKASDTPELSRISFISKDN
ncbi:MAG: hypothetical protein EA412_13265 [Chitinophagaceae bacterium]|nr:MAG: hypothetical protein EA412_13265 [Chitinophagaceae bacterium]